MKNYPRIVKHVGKSICCIDEMEDLLDQIADFKKFISNPHNASDPRYQQEIRLFRQHVEWVSEDLASSSFISYPDINSRH